MTESFGATKAEIVKLESAASLRIVHPRRRWNTYYKRVDDIWVESDGSNSKLHKGDDISVLLDVIEKLLLKETTP